MGVAPDHYATKIGRNLALAEKWLVTQTDQRRQQIWAEYQNSGAKRVQIAVVPQTLHFMCSCGSRKLPCNHLLALLLLWSEQPDAFEIAQPPEWVQQWSAQSTAPITDASQVPHAADERAHQDERRLRNTVAGLQELKLWLQDMVRGGFGALENRPPYYWDTMANRLVDCQAATLGRELKAIGTYVRMATSNGASKSTTRGNSASTEWPQKLLARLGRIHLLIQGFERFDTLSPQTQTDLREAVGWLSRLSAAEPYTEAVADQWLIMGKVVTDEGRYKMQRSWLWGRHTNRAAQIIHLLYKPQSVELSLLVGAAVEAELIFAPSSTALRAECHVRGQMAQPTHFVAGYTSIATATAAYAAAITANPWLPHFPIALPAVWARRQGETWFIQDAAGDLLPLPPSFEYGWHLSALGRNAPFCLFGEWDGECFTPLTIWQEGRLIELAVLKGVK